MQDTSAQIEQADHNIADMDSEKFATNEKCSTKGCKGIVYMWYPNEDTIVWDCNICKFHEES